VVAGWPITAVTADLQGKYASPRQGKEMNGFTSRCIAALAATAFVAVAVLTAGSVDQARAQLRVLLVM
jgi:hypothetical protein